MKSTKLALGLLIAGAVFGAEVIVINGDPPGVGFNNPAPATPVGGNPGTTVGQQALNVFQRAANIWGGKLVSKQPILIIAFFTPLSCTATTGVLGAAGANWFFGEESPVNGGKELKPGTWYPAALAEKLTRRDLTTEADPTDPFEIFALFNSNLGQPGCLTASGWYYGLDNNEPANRVDLLGVVLHEFGHGLGFSVGPTSGNSGTRLAGFPSVWESNLLDTATGKSWIDMTNAERAASARRDGALVWTGKQVTSAIPSVLDFRLEIETPLGTAEAWQSSLGSGFVGPRSGTLVAPNDGGGVSLQDGCEAFPAAANVAGNILLVDRGNCTFAQKAIVAQNAGAAGLVIANNAAGPLIITVTDPAVTISIAGITQAAGTALRTAAPFAVRIQRNPLIRVGTTAGYARLFAPNPFQSGSSVSHWDTSLTPSMLMEPFITSGIGSRVQNPDDLSLNLLKDIGW